MTHLLLDLRADIDGADPDIWRRVQLRSDVALSEVPAVLRALFCWRDPDGFSREDAHAPETPLGDVLAEPGQKLTFLYDARDRFSVTLRLLGTEPLGSETENDDDAPAAAYTEGEGAGPLEGIGGIERYNQLVARHVEGTLDPAFRQAMLPEGWDPGFVHVSRIALGLGLVGRTREESEALAEAQLSSDPVQGALRPHEAVTALELRLTGAPSEVFTYELGRAMEASSALSEAQILGATKPHRFLLHMAAEGGIALDERGFMVPEVMEQAFERLNLGEYWFGKGLDEEAVLPVADLRAAMTADDLLRVSEGRIFPTKRGHALLSRPEALLEYQIRKLIPESRMGRDFAVFALVSLILGDPQRELLPLKLASAGWLSADGGPMGEGDLHPFFGELGGRLMALGEWEYPFAEPTPIQQAIAHRALFRAA